MAAAGWTRLVIVADDIITVIVQPVFDSKKPPHARTHKHDARAAGKNKRATAESRNPQY